jgi:hypothetical protein
MLLMIIMLVAWLAIFSSINKVATCNGYLIKPRILFSYLDWEIMHTCIFNQVFRIRMTFFFYLLNYISMTHIEMVWKLKAEISFISEYQMQAPLEFYFSFNLKFYKYYNWLLDISAFNFGPEFPFNIGLYDKCF